MDDGRQNSQGERWPIQAMRDRRIPVEVVCMSKGYVVMGSGLVLPIVGYYDEDRRRLLTPEEINEEACYYEFGNDRVGYALGNLAAYDMPSWEDH